MYYNIATPFLLSTLKSLMKNEVFNPFRLVGGTALALQLGHRISVDIDLFSDMEYGTLDFRLIDRFLKHSFSYVDSFESENIGFGKSYFIGDSPNQSVKLDVFYTDTFIRPELKIDGIRIAHLDDIVAMKMDIVTRKARKKDFWDLHELLYKYSFEEMMKLHAERYPYPHDKAQIISGLKDFEKADDDFDPVCLKNKYWELIKLDILEALDRIR